MSKFLLLVTSLIGLFLIIFSESYIELLQFSFFDKLIETDVSLLSQYCNASRKENCLYSAENYIYSFYFSLILGLVLSVIAFFISKKNSFDASTYEEITAMLAVSLLAAPFSIVLALSVPEINQFPLSKFSSLQQNLGKFWFVLNIACSSGWAYSCFVLMQISKSLLRRIRLS